MAEEPKCALFRDSQLIIELLAMERKVGRRVERIVQVLRISREIIR
jgi:hypothetical protein